MGGSGGGGARPPALLWFSQRLRPLGGTLKKHKSARTHKKHKPARARNKGASSCFFGGSWTPPLFLAIQSPEETRGSPAPPKRTRGGPPAQETQGDPQALLGGTRVGAMTVLLGPTRAPVGWGFCGRAYTGGNVEAMERGRGRESHSRRAGAMLRRARWTQQHSHRAARPWSMPHPFLSGRGGRPRRRCGR